MSSLADALLFAMSSTLDADLAKSATRVITHMNDDHTDSLLAYAAFYAGLQNATSARMSGLTSKGFELDVTLIDGTVKKGVLIPYTTPLKSAGEVRKLAVSMHFAAYNGMGIIFKIKQNYYGNAVKQAWTHMPAKVKYPMAAALVSVIAACAKGVQLMLR